VTEARSIRVGLCGFTMAMEDYPLRFPVVEVQQTFYQPPADATMRRWLAVTPPGFEYTLKAWQLVTHAASSSTYRRTKRLLTDGERARCGSFQKSAIVDEGHARSIECARLLGATAMLFQCPASYAPTAENIARMRVYFTRDEHAPPRIGGRKLRYLWEPRGPKWVEARDEASALASELGLVHVVDPFVTEPARGPVYFRLHGIGGARHSYTDDELRRLLAMVERAHDPASGPAYVMFNNLPRVGDAMRFLALLR
jgi:uncharacterized protein YecE (DUF72 family)